MAEETETVVAEPIVRLQDMTEEARMAYLKDEKAPDEAQPSKEIQSADTAQPAEVKTGAESDPAEKEESTEEEAAPPSKSRYQRRIDRLTAQVKELEARIAQSGTETRTESRAAIPSKAPKFQSFRDQIGSKYADWEEAHDAYEDAKDAFYADQQAKAVKDALQAEQSKLEQAKEQQAQQKALEANGKQFAKRAEVFRATLKQDDFQAAFTDVYEAVNEAMATRPDVSQIADALVESEVGPNLIYYFGQKPEEFDKLLELPIWKALRELGKLEVSDVIKTPTPKTKTAAKKLGSSVTGANAGTGDPEEEAVKNNDIGSFLRADPNFAKRRGAAW